MKRRFLFISLMAGVFVYLCLVGQIGAAPIMVDVSNTMKPGGAEEAAIDKFKEVVEKESGGRMQIRKFMSGQLGAELEVYQLLKIGQTQVYLAGSTFRAEFAREYDAGIIPYYFPTYQCLKAFLEGPFGMKIKEAVASKGGILDFGPQYRASRQMTANRKIVEPEDLKGLKLRLPEDKCWIDVWKELGTLPIVVPAQEIYMAMKTGQIEAHENSLASPYTRKLWEVQKYVILTNHIYDPWHWVASKVWFEKLDPQDQKVIVNAIKVATEVGDKKEEEMDVFYAKELQKNGMVFITPNVAAIRQKAKPAIDRQIKGLAPGVADEVERVCK